MHHTTTQIIVVFGGTTLGSFGALKLDECMQYKL